MADVLGVHGKDANPHLWYDVPRLGRIAERDRRRARAAPIRRTPPPTAPACAASTRSLGPLRREVATIRGALPRRAGRVHRAGPRLPHRGGRAAQPRARERSRAPIEDGSEPSPAAVVRDGRADRAAPDPRAALQQPGRLPHHRAAARRGASGRDPGRAGERDAAGRTAPSSSGSSTRRARSPPRSQQMSVVVADDLALRFGERTLFEGLGFELERGRAARRPRPERHRQDVADPDPARAARAERGQGRDRRLPAARALPPDRLRAAAAGLRPRPRPARTRPRAARARRPPLGLRPARRRRSAPGSTRVLDEVGATAYADAPVGRLSGGEQQRLRVAQALVADPVLILADEPLLSLDLAHQRGVVDLLDARRRGAGTPVVFVTHDINPVLQSVDRVLYLAPDGWAIGDAGRGADVGDAVAPVRDGGGRASRARPRRRRRHAGRPARPPRRQARPLMFTQLLAQHFVHTALWAGAVVAVVSGAIGVFVVTRGMSFAVHAISELGFTGAAGALVLGIDPVIGMIGGSLARRPRARPPLAARARARQRDRRGARVRARPRRPLPLALPGLRDRGDEPPLRQHRRRLRHAAPQPRDRRPPSSSSASSSSTGRCSSRASTRRSPPPAACRCARSRWRSSCCSR